MLRYGRSGDARAGCSNLDKRTARLVDFAVALGHRTGARFVAVNWGAGDCPGSEINTP